MFCGASAKASVGSEGEGRDSASTRRPTQRQSPLVRSASWAAKQGYQQRVL